MFPSRPRFDSELGQSFFTFIYFCFIFLKGVRFRVKTNVFFSLLFFFFVSTHHQILFNDTFLLCMTP